MKILVSCSPTCNHIFWGKNENGIHGRQEKAVIAEDCGIMVESFKTGTKVDLE